MVMKEMIKRVREEKGGFTLAELLIVVAIILVLVAIAIPVFT
ncbi:MAG: prepilin-type N-terminal cleavage/methylation domain-containing protein, partial [Gordonibacter sp.]